MARLVKESGILGKAGEDLTAKNLDQKVSYDQIIQAIHKVQENMGITGTTAKEAASTIEGSSKSMKASWQNLLTGIADDTQDLDKLIDNFVDNVVTYSNNLVPRIKKSVDGIKKLINNIITEVFPKLKREIPELRPLIETFEWFIEHKTLVVNSLKAIVAAFAVNKILSFTKTLSDGSKGLLSIAKDALTSAAALSANTAATTAATTAQTASTVAQVAGATATKGLAIAQGLLNAAWNANPIGLIITGVTALISVFSLLKGKTDEVTEAEKAQEQAIKDQAQAIEDNKASWEDLQKTRQDTIDAGMTEIAHYETLWDELQGIVDQNGKVKKGYEERASFITSTLSEALGTEITTVDGVIQKYDDLKSTIDEVMEKKKAQIILDSQESLYSEAIQKQTDAVKTLNEIEQQLDDKREERSQLEQERKALEEQLNNTYYENEQVLIMEQIKDIDKKIKKKDEETADIESNYKEQEDLFQSYAYNIGQYEQNMALFHEGKYEEMTNVNWDYVKEYQKAGDAEKAQLEDQISVTESTLDELKKLKDKSGSDIYDSQIKAAEKQLKQQKESLKKYESATETGLDATKIKWQNGLDKVLSTITGKDISFKEDGKGNVQMYIDGVASGEAKSKEEMASIVSDTIKEVTKKDKDAKEAGENLIDGVNKGVKNQDKQSGVFSSIAKFGGTLLSKLKASLKENSPSKATKEMGQFLLEGLGVGIEKEEDNVLDQVSNVGKNVLSALQDELNQNVRLGNIQASVNSSSSSAENKYYSTVEAFKEALSEMKIELDDETAGKFVEKTVARAIYS